jgi:TP901 family phage tail tape measure protein
VSTSTELADLFITLRAVNAPILSGFTETAVAGEEMVTKLDAELARFDAMIARTGEALAALRGEMSAVGESGVGAVPQVAPTTAVAPAAAGAESTAGTDAAVKSEQELGAAAAETGAEYTASRTQMRDAQGRFVAAESAGTDSVLAGYKKLIAEAQASAAEVSASMSEMSATTKSASAGMVAAQDSAAASNKALGAAVDDSAVRAKESLAKYGMVAAAAGVAGAELVKVAADYQTSTTRLVTSGGEFSKNLATDQQGMLALTSQVGYSAEDLSSAMYKITSAGQHGTQALNTLKAAAQGAKTENADLVTVADAVSTVMIDYAKDGMSAADVTSKLVAATSQGKTNFQDLAGSMSAILPKASQAGIAFNEIVGDLASMTQHGISAQQASQNLANAVSHLQSPTMAMSKEMAALGLNSTELAQHLGDAGLTGTINKISQAIQKDMGPGSTAVILNMQDALKGLPAPVQQISQEVINGNASWAEWNASLKGLTVTQRAQAQSFATLYNSMHTIGTEQMSGAQVMQTYAGAMGKAMGTSDGLNVALMLTGQNLGNTATAVDAVTKAVADANGNVAGWTEIQGTLNQKVAEAKDGLGALAIQIGSVLLPPVSKIIGLVGNLTKGLSDNKGMATALAIIIGGTFVVALGALATKLLAVSRGSVTVVGQLSLLAGALDFGLSHMHSFAGVATLVVVGLIAIGVAAKALNGPWAAMSGSFAKAQTELVAWVAKIGAAEGAMATFKVVSSGVLSFLTGPWGMAIGAAVALFGLFSSSSSGATQSTVDFTSAIQQDSGALGDNTRAQVENTLEKDNAGQAATDLGINMSTLTDAVMGNKEALDQVNSSLAKHFSSVNEAVSALANGDQATQQAAAAYITLHGAIPQVTKDVQSSTDAYKRQQQAGTAAAGAIQQAGSASQTAANQGQDLTQVQNKLTTAMDLTSSATTNVASTVGGASTQVSDALSSMSTAASDLNNQLDLLNGGNISAEQSLLTVRDDVDKVSKAFKDNGKSLDDNSTAGRANITAILDAASAAQKHAQAVTQQTGDVQKGNDAFNADVIALQGVMSKAGLTSDQIKTLTGLYLQVPHDLTTNVTTPGLDQALTGIQRYANEVAQAGTVGVAGRVRGYATGGRVGYPGGGRVSGPGTSTSDSVAAMLSNDEEVINAASARKATYPVLDALNAGDLRQAYSLLGSVMGGDGAHSGAGLGGMAVGGGGGGATNVYVTINAGAVADEMRLQRLLQTAVLRYTGRNSSSGWKPAFT